MNADTNELNTAKDSPPGRALLSQYCTAIAEIVRRLRPFFLLVLVLVVVLERKGQSEDEDENADEDDSAAALLLCVICVYLRSSAVFSFPNFRIYVQRAPAGRSHADGDEGSGGPSRPNSGAVAPTLAEMRPPSETCKI